MQTTHTVCEVVILIPHSHVHTADLLEKIPFFKGKSSSFISTIAPLLHPVFASPVGALLAPSFVFLLAYMQGVLCSHCHHKSMLVLLVLHLNRV